MKVPLGRQYSNDSVTLNTDINLHILSIEHDRQMETVAKELLFKGHSFSPVVNEIAQHISTITPDERNQSIIFDRVGLGSTPQTLESIAERHHLTRERVRQIADKHLSKATNSFISIPDDVFRANHPLLSRTIELLTVHREGMDNPAERRLDDYRDRQIYLAACQFSELGLLASPDEFRTIATWLVSLLDLPIDGQHYPPYVAGGSWWDSLVWPMDLDVTSYPEHQRVLRDYFNFVIQTFSRKFQRLPNASLAAIHRLRTRGWLETQDPKLANDIKGSLNAENIEHVHYGSWIIRNDESRNNFRDSIGRVLTVLGNLTTNEIVEALANAKPGRSDYAINISEQDLEKIFALTDWVEDRDGKWHWRQSAVEVGKVDVQIYAALKQLPPVFFWAEALNAVQGIASVAALSFFLKGPYGQSLRHNMYCIRGTRYNALDLARKLPAGLKGQVSASAEIVSHDPDVFHVIFPTNWNAQVHLGRFYANHWTVYSGAFSATAKVNAQGVLVSGLAPLIKKMGSELSIDLIINPSKREIQVVACDLPEH